ncbi:unnamed protein product [Pipistrellus nathusii]|uniref:Uncharacterized protein n=1 Tax=Pipistrellus nathusii TaxID=59473 RepID=A0ABP0A6A3_PIPNA
MQGPRPPGTSLRSSWPNSGDGGVATVGCLGPREGSPQGAWAVASSSSGTFNLQPPVGQPGQGAAPLMRQPAQGSPVHSGIREPAALHGQVQSLSQTGGRSTAPTPMP